LLFDLSIFIGEIWIFNFILGLCVDQVQVLAAHLERSRQYEWENEVGQDIVEIVLLAEITTTKEPVSHLQKADPDRDTDNCSKSSLEWRGSHPINGINWVDSPWTTKPKANDVEQYAASHEGLSVTQPSSWTRFETRVAVFIFLDCKVDEIFLVVEPLLWVCLISADANC